MKEIITFAGFPYCQDLDALDADIAVIGIPYGTPYDAEKPPHSLNAPSAIRRESVRYPDDPTAWDFDLGGALLENTGVRVVDCGDLSGNQNEPQGNRLAATDAIRKILNAAAIPIVLGGDDSIPVPVMRAYEGQEPFYVFQLDAHIDWRDEVNGVREGYSSTMRRASEMPWVSGIIQSGMRGVGSARKAEYQAALDYGAKIITSAMIQKEGLQAVLNLLPSGSRCFLTIDFDVFDPAVLPAVGAPTPGGLSFIEGVELIHAVAQQTQIVGVCLVELVPELDINNLGSVTAMRTAWNIVGSLARSISNH